MIFETERLILREMNQSDFIDLCEIMQDKEVVYAYEHEFSHEDVQNWLDKQYLCYQQDGFGLWAILLKETNQMIGQAGLTKQLCIGEEVLEIGYLLKKKYWHNGYAQEAVQGCKQYAFDVLGVNKVYAIIKFDNIASQKVAHAIGMTKEKEFITQYYHGDMLHYLYSIKK